MFWFQNKTDINRKLFVKKKTYILKTYIIK